MSNILKTTKKYREYTHILIGAYLKRTKKRLYGVENDPTQQDLIRSSNLKNEYIGHRDFESFQDAKITISYVLDNYNQYSVHFTIKYATASKFGVAWRAMTK